MAYVAYMQDFSILRSEFELKSFDYVHFKTNTQGKIMDKEKNQIVRINIWHRKQDETW